MEKIDQIREAEEGNYQVARRVLGDSVSLVEDLLGLYKLIGQMTKESGVEPRDEIVCALTFLLACHYQLTIGSLTLLRGYLTDSFFYLRKAIELCAFAVRVKRHPHLGMEWLRAGDDDASYESYSKKFSGSKIFPDDHPLLKQLEKRYDDCSKQIHSSIYALARHCMPEGGEKEFRINFNYFELKDNDPSEPIRTLLYVIDTHFGILRVFEEVLSDVIKHDPKKWEIRRNAVDGKIGVHKEKWKKVILPAFTK